MKEKSAKEYLEETKLLRTKIYALQKTIDSLNLELFELKEHLKKMPSVSKH
jgi:hypothetical protein